MAFHKKRTLLILSILLLYGFCIGIEKLYRKPLFNISVSIIENISRERTSGLNKFFAIITSFGTAAIILAIFGIIFNWYPLATSFTFVQNYALAAYIDNILKLIYSNPRPYWVLNQVEPILCDGGYGNPSGHAYSSSAVYLALWHITANNEYFNKHKWLKGLYLIFILCFIFTILYSRFYFGVHSINQLLYGFSLGTTQYAFLFVVMKQQDFHYEKFFKIFTTLWSNIIYWSIYLSFLLILIFVYCFKEPDHTYLVYLQYVCPKTNRYGMLEYNGVVNALNIFLLYGAHLGLSFLYFLIKRKYQDNNTLESVFNFNSTSFIRSLLRIVIIGLIIMPTLLPAILIPPTVNFAVFSICKIAIPYMLTFFILYSIGIYIALRYNFIFIKNSENNNLPSDNEKIPSKDDRFDKNNINNL